MPKLFVKEKGFTMNIDAKQTETEPDPFLPYHSKQTLKTLNFCTFNRKSQDPTEKSMPLHQEQEPQSWTPNKKQFLICKLNKDHSFMLFFMKKLTPYGLKCKKEVTLLGKKKVKSLERENGEVTITCDKSLSEMKMEMWGRESCFCFRTNRYVLCHCVVCEREIEWCQFVWANRFRRLNWRES